MRKYLVHIVTALCLLAVSCQRIPESTAVQVPVLAGGMISGITPGYDTRASLEDFLSPKPLPEKLDLPVGTTLYLLIEVPDPENENNWVQDHQLYPLKSYVVGGGNSLYPCIVDKEGRCVEQSGSPLMLSEGRYRFHAVSPARSIRDTVINGREYKNVMPIHNGEYVIATDSRWEETAPTEAEVHITTGNAVMPITLNPLINHTAELVFNIKKGSNITRLEVLSAGVEISGIQNDKSGIPFLWTLDGAELQMMVGDKYHGIKIPRWEETAEGLRGSVSILPTDAFVNAIYITFNIAVNGIPTQYMATLNHQYYMSAHRYTYNYKVDVEGGITVAPWANITIIQEGDFTQPGEQDYTD